MFHLSNVFQSENDGKRPLSPKAGRPVHGVAAPPMISRIPASNLWAAGCALAVGLFGLWESSRYPFRMDGIIGPAVFPLILSALLAACSLAILVEGALRGPAAAEEEEGGVRWRSLLAITGGLGAFVLLLPRVGLVPAIFATVLIASLADSEATPRRSLLVGCGLSLACTIVFVWFLNLPMRPFRL
jgi:hypothetical protein